MNALMYFSCTGETKKVNDYFQNKLLDIISYNLTDYNTRNSFNFTQKFNLIILSIPVHSEHIPIPLRQFIPKLQTKYLLINLTYGSITPGKAVNKLIKLTKAKIIGLSLIPSKHSYYNHYLQSDFKLLDKLIEKVKTNNYQEINIPKFKGHHLAPLFEKLRTKYNIKIIRNLEDCNHCKLCINECPVQAIDDNYHINKNCLRCLRCVYVCPKKVINFQRSKLLSFYLRKNLKQELIKVFL